MTNIEFATKLDYCYAQLNPATIVTANGVSQTIKIEPTKEHIDRCKEGLLALLKECRRRGWLPSEV